MNKFFYVSALLLMVFVLGLACKTGTHHMMIEPIKDQGADYLFEQMKKNEFSYKRLSLRFGAEVEFNNESNSFSGNIYIVKDSMMWISIQKFGLEAVRVLITADSAKMMNRINKTYFIGDFGKINDLFNTDFDFDILQSVITGNDVCYYENNIFKASLDNKNYRLSTLGRKKLKKFVHSEKENSKVLIQDLWLEPDHFKIINSEMKEVKTQDKRKLKIGYSDFLEIENQRFAQKISFEVVDDKKAKGEITFSRISPERQESAPFTIPKNYEPSKKQ